MVKPVVGNRRGATAGVPDAQQKWAVVGLNFLNKFIVTGAKSSSFVKQRNVSPELLENTWGQHFFPSNWSQVNEITITHSRHQVVTCHRCQGQFQGWLQPPFAPLISHGYLLSLLWLHILHLQNNQTVTAAEVLSVTNSVIRKKLTRPPRSMVK